MALAVQQARFDLALWRERLRVSADWLAVALVVSLPWSTSATAILAVLWLLAALPALDAVQARHWLRTAAGILPLLLFGLAVVGMAWADIAWAERVRGLSAFAKLLLLPLLAIHFQRSDRAGTVLAAFLLACAALLATSWAMLWFPALQPPGFAPGVPVKDYIFQAGLFSACALILVHMAIDRWQQARRGLAAVAVFGALLLIANILYVAPSRTAWVTLPLLLLLLGLVRLGWKAAVAFLVVMAVIAAAAWPTATALRTRVTALISDVEGYRSDGRPTAAGLRLEFWRKSVDIIAAAPFIGHGTGSIRAEYAKTTEGQTGMAGVQVHNPHNQTLHVAIQFGLLGVVVLWAMWIAHARLFWQSGLTAWVGLLVVAQNMIGSLFNSHIADFNQGWAYVLGVGIAAGALLRQRDRAGEGKPASGPA